MLAMLNIAEKSIGAKLLFEDLKLTIEEGQTIAIIGRNGVGKTTLFRMLTGEDEDYTGTIDVRRGVRIVSTAQEHFDVVEKTPLDYILDNVPDYRVSAERIETLPDTMGDDMEKISAYADALDIWHQRDFDHLADRVAESLQEMGLSLEQTLGLIGKLSGGEKRLMELVKVEFSEADLALLDEPTNHLDVWGKAAFIRWLDSTKHSVLLVTHDRDVLRHVSRILEIKDQRAQTFPGNYDAYLAQNAISTVTLVARYEESLKRLEILKGQIHDTQVKKVAAFSSRFKSQEDRLQREYDNLKLNLQRPSLWIDQSTAAAMDPEQLEHYDKYKDRNIQVRTRALKEHGKRLLQVKAISLGYETPLFAHVQFELSHGDRILLKGRNGAGKSTLVRAILATIAEAPFDCTLFQGSILPTSGVRVGVYEQELPNDELDMPLERVIMKAYADRHIELDDQNLRRIMAMYLFDPREDALLTMRRLSGGQKARVQLIKMLANMPNLLVLDEPTNHLDLPSIEELENALKAYDGAILYVSHDNAFVKAIGGSVVPIPPGVS